MKISGADLKLKDIASVAAAENGTRIELDKNSLNNMEKSYNYLQKRILSGESIYGVNTGFGAFSKVKIQQKDIRQLQVNLVRSHAVGIGAPLSKAETRAILLLRANALARGTSGIRPIVVEKILEFLEKNILPVIPSQGSVGASGDLAPLSHVALALIGEGECWDGDKKVPTKALFSKLKTEPLVLQEKEGLALINGCQVMTGIGLLALHRILKLLPQFDLAGAMSLEALRGGRSPFHPKVSENRPHRGEIQTAKNLSLILGKTSPIAESHVDCDRVQDPYSLRCMPAVHGAARDAMARTFETLMIEANSSTDNPLVFPEEDAVISCGNFHGQPVAAVLDYAAMALTSLMSISERRIEKLINPAMSGLPAFLAKEGGLNSGLMLVHVAAAALVSESKILSHPASVDSIPTSADKEDHVSMGTIAARKLVQIVNHLEHVLAMEFLCAHQALYFLRPLQPAGVILKTHLHLEKVVPFAIEDRHYGIDIENIRKCIVTDEIYDLLNQNLKGLES